MCDLKTPELISLNMENLGNKLSSQEVKRQHGIYNIYFSIFLPNFYQAQYTFKIHSKQLKLSYVFVPNWPNKPALQVT